MLEPILIALIEIFSAIDLYYDLIVIIQLADSEHTSWLTLMIFTMLCPYLTVYTSFINYLMKWTKEIQTINKFHCGHALVLILFILPTMLIIMIAIDIIFIVVYVALYFFIIIIYLVKRDAKIFERLDNLSNWLFMKIFAMSLMEVRGFRCQRTIQ